MSATDRRWLFVLDDLASPADLAGLWPDGPTGQVLATTRCRDAPGALSLVELERFCFLDDADLRLVNKCRADPLRLGFDLQLVTVRFVGRFLADPLDVPGVVLDFMAEQLQVADPPVKPPGDLSVAYKVRRLFGP